MIAFAADTGIESTESSSSSHVVVSAGAVVSVVVVLIVVLVVMKFELVVDLVLMDPVVFVNAVLVLGRIAELFCLTTVQLSVEHQHECSLQSLKRIQIVAEILVVNLLKFLKSVLKSF